MKQLATALLAIVLALSPVIGAFGFVNFKVNAVGTEDELDVSKYFYKQLNSDRAQKFYSVMEKMLADETFIKGESVDLIDNGTFDEATAKAYGSALLNDFGAARDAFYFDHPSVFYVDFSALSLRATTDKDGGYHLYLGTGRYDTYYTEGFETEADVRAAIAAYDAALDAFVEDVKANCDRDEKKETLKHAEVEYAHDKLADLVSYKLENVCTPEYRGFIRTAYGALVCKEGVCEAYTRAFKAVMDKLEIPCVMVQGVYRHNDTKHGSEEGVDELHIWNYVYLYDPYIVTTERDSGKVDDDGKPIMIREFVELKEGTEGGWYGVDVTMDDPIYSNGMNKPTTEYLLAGSSVMTRNHIPDGVLSEADHEFTYPELSLDGYALTYTEYTGTDSNGKTVTLRIGYNPFSTTDGDTTPAGQYIVSINGKGVQEAWKDGYYLLIRHGLSETKTDEDGNPLEDENGIIISGDKLDEKGDVVMDDWLYADPQVYGMPDFDEYIDLRYAQISWLEFAVTEAPINREVLVDGRFGVFRPEDDKDIVVKTDKPMNNINGEYKAPPYPNLKDSTPSMQGNLDIDGSTYTIKTVWDDKLMRVSDSIEPTVKVYAEHWLGDARVHNSSVAGSRRRNIARSESSCGTRTIPRRLISSRAICLWTTVSCTRSISRDLSVRRAVSSRSN